MYRRPIYVGKPDESYQAIVRATFPNYKGKKFRICQREQMQLYGTQWEGGSRNQYRVVRLDGLKVAVVPEHPFLRPSQLHDEPHPMQPGIVVVEHSHFCGKDAGITIHCHPEELKILPPPAAPLADDERTVLEFTSSLKSTYGGVRNLRFVEAHRKTGITADRWETSKAALIGRKLLRKNGAITPDGRNAISA